MKAQKILENILKKKINNIIQKPTVSMHEYGLEKMSESLKKLR